MVSLESKLLNKPGRLTLANLVIASLSSYDMQIQWHPHIFVSILMCLFGPLFGKARMIMGFAWWVGRR